ncbi:glutathione S-transferase [Sulfitobacter aestuariivivens]|uniref:Glutathione S-transferase n=1 Tax=Sulfitobacter aestuariivivens TaxID=2766981 RepID=A0A927D4H9_9RHOB|nr:glutathione S-transferase [Sulfitobacter aestuariivivens]MBD3664983.1 glutathione S-transferase [Sulfitobacter aestuariivivens]
MKLIHSPMSPYVRKIHVMLHELGKTDAVELHEVQTTAFQSDDALVATNPLGKIPALQRDDGITLYDSRVISTFLNETYQGGLYPQGGRKWETLVLEATGDGIMDSTVSMSYEMRLRPENEQSPKWIEAQWEKASRAIGVINSRWMSHLHGPLDMAQISVACALSYANFRHGARQWQTGNTALAEWHGKFESRPSMQATKPPEV